MKKLLIFLCAILFALGLATSVNATEISAGETTIFSFDFFGLSPSPPYEDFNFSSAYTVLTEGDASVKFVFFDNLSDPEGSKLTNSWISGYMDVEPPLTDTFNLSVPYTNFPTLETTQYVGVEVMDGTFSMDIMNLRMSHHDNGDTVYTSWVAGQPINIVPEPSTILLLGFGLAGVGLFRKRFKK